MKFPSSTVAVAVAAAAAVPASGQLLGFGSTCPSIEMVVTNLASGSMVEFDGWDSGTLMAVVHSPEFNLVDYHDQASNALYDIFSNNGRGYGNCVDDVLTPSQFGVANNPQVCGGADEGYYVHEVGCEDMGNDDVAPTYEYDPIYLTPVNTAQCSCGNMRISILAKSQAPILAFLDGHELPSLSSVSYAHAGGLGLSCDDEGCDRRGPICDSAYCIPVRSALIVSDDCDFDDSADVTPLDYLSIKFTPTSGTSTSFLSLWALLMHGWY